MKFFFNKIKTKKQQLGQFFLRQRENYNILFCDHSQSLIDWSKLHNSIVLHKNDLNCSATHNRKKIHSEIELQLLHTCCEKTIHIFSVFIFLLSQQHISRLGRMNKENIFIFK